MRTDKELAFALRKQGKSYKQIHKELGMSVSTLSNWFKGVNFSEEIKMNLTEAAIDVSAVRIRELNKARGDTLAALYFRAKEEAAEELKHRIKDPLFVSAIAAYWGEGDKLSKNQLRLTNTDPHMIILFKDFLVKICGIPKEKLRIALFIYKDLDEVACKNYWIKQVGLTHFHKTMVLPSRHKTKRLPYGICTLVLSNTYLKQKMIVWIDQLPKMVLNIGPEAKEMRP